MLVIQSGKYSHLWRKGPNLATYAMDHSTILQRLVGAGNEKKSPTGTKSNCVRRTNGYLLILSISDFGGYPKFLIEKNVIKLFEWYVYIIKIPSSFMLLIPF